MAVAYEVAPGADPVLCIHGISSQRRLWDWLRVEQPDLPLVLPDLRGRGDSVGLGGPYGLDRHVDDLVELLDALGLGAVAVCGMSMGAFVAVRLAAAHPERVRGVVLVDGGLPMTAPVATADDLAVVFADRLARLERRWDSLEEYRDFFVANTAPLLDANDPVLQGYLAHDLDDGRVRLDADALIADGQETFFRPNPWREVAARLWLLHAEFSVGPGSAPAYPTEVVEAARPHLAGAELLPGLDHAGSIMTPAGARAAATAIAAARAVR